MAAPEASARQQRQAQADYRSLVVEQGVAVGAGSFYSAGTVGPSARLPPAGDGG